jgi:cation transport regulator ChaC
VLASCAVRKVGGAKTRLSAIWKSEIKISEMRDQENENVADYVFGYGSLLERASRTRTNPDAIGAWPALVKGFERGWFHQFRDPVGSTCTFLAAKAKEEGSINGVIYPVADLQSTKDREVGYTATALEADQIKMLDGGGDWDVQSGPVYIFLSNQDSISETGQPTLEIPMVQSYVDICINGCLEIEALYRRVKGHFVADFIRSTSGWNKFWVNDRIYPRRPFIYTPNATAIDNALKGGEVLQYRQLRD